MNGTNQPKDYYVWINDYDMENLTLSFNATEKNIIPLKNADSDELKLGKNTITKPEQYVSYRDEESEIRYTNGRILSYTPSKEQAKQMSLKFTCPSGSEYAYDINCFKLMTDGTVNPYLNKYVNPNWTCDGFALSYDDDLTVKYFVIVRAYKDGQLIDAEEAYQNLSLEVTNTLPSYEEFLSSADEVSAGQTYELQHNNLNFVWMGDTNWIDYVVDHIYVCKLTLPAKKELKCTITNQYEQVPDSLLTAYVKENGTYTKQTLQDKKYTGRSIYSLQNETDEAQTFYLVLSKMNGSDESLKFGEISDYTEISNSPIEQASVKELVVDEKIDLNHVMKQAISFKDNSSDQNIKYTGKWVKLTVPAGKVYYLIDDTDNISYPDYVIEYDADWNPACYNQQNYEHNAYYEGVYYLCYADESENAERTITLKDAPGIQTLKDKAVPITDAEIQTGKFKTKYLNQIYAYQTKWMTEGGFGNLHKITVSPYTSYLLKSYYDFDICVYSDDAETFVDYNNIVNDTDKEKTFYIWTGNTRYSSNILSFAIQIEKSESVTSRYASAEKLVKGKTTFRYDETNPSYAKKLINNTNYYNKKEFAYAKVYCLDTPGDYTLTLTADNADVNHAAYLIDDFESTKISSRSEIYLDAGEKKYLVVTADPDNLNANVYLTLSDTTDNRRITKNDDEATELVMGSNVLLSTGRKDYYYYDTDTNDDGISKIHGILESCKLYKYVVKPNSNIVIDAESLSKGYITFVSSDGHIDRTIFGEQSSSAKKCIFKNKESVAQTIYLLAVVETDTTIKISDSSDKKYVEKIEISAGDKDLTNILVGDTFKLSATVTPDDADDTSIYWECEDEDIASVDRATGEVKALKKGKTFIYATANDDFNTYAELEITIRETACTHADTELRNVKAATCTTLGYTGDTYCKICNTVLEKGKTVDMKAHTSSDWIVDKAATVDAEGSRHKECTVCKTVLEKEAIAKLPKPDPTPDPKPQPDPTPQPEVTPDVTVRYTTHVQSIGWQGDENDANKWFVNGSMAGTSGRAKRLEGIKIRVSGNSNLGIQYTTHCQTYGWLPWSSNGEMNGTQGEAKRLEAIKIRLTGKDKDKYDVYYRVHAQSYGWLGWAKNGACAGTAGQGKRLEGIQILVVKKNTPAPGLSYADVNLTDRTNLDRPYVTSISGDVVIPGYSDDTNIMYKTHVQTYGWQGWKLNGAVSGTFGEAKRLEGINIRLTNQQYSGSVVYTTHVQTYGWQGNESNPNTWKRDGQMSGTSGEAKRLEAIRIALTGEMAKHYDIYYRVHAQSFGWLNWAKNGEPSGTAGLAKRLEGIQIVLVPKGSGAPSNTYNNVTAARRESFIK